MKFDRLRLQNWKCYGDADLALDRGVTVVHGLNGSGKSSLLEAAFFALYGAGALDATTLDEVITNGETEAEIELWFTHGGQDYRIERHLRISNDRASTVHCDLETPDGTISGARDVREYVTSMLRMDADAFVNCAYVRQGEVNKLIHATPRERQDMIDELLQLGTLETYRERASHARLGIGTVRDGYAESLRQLEAQIEEKEEKDLPGTLNDLESKLATTDEEIDHFEGQVEQARETLETATDLLDRHEERRAELDELSAEIEELLEEISQTEAERERLASQRSECREEIEAYRERLDELFETADLAERSEEAVEAKIEELRTADEGHRDDIEAARVELQEHASAATALADEATAADERAEAKRERASELEGELENDDETLAERREKLSALAEEIEAERSRFDDAPVEPEGAFEHLETVREELEERTERKTALEATLEARREAVREAEALLAAGKCPECGQPVEDSPHVDSIDDERARVEELELERSTLADELASARERLAEAEALVEAQRTIERLTDNRRSLSQLIDERAAAMEEKRAQIETLRTDATALEAEAEAKRANAEEEREAVARRRERIAELNEERGSLKERIERLTEIESIYEALETASAELDRLEERRTQRGELNDERRRRLGEKRDRKAELEETTDDEQLEAARTDKRRAEAYLEEVETKLEELGSRRDRLLDRIGGIKNEFDELDELRARREELEAKVDALARVHRESETLETLYADLRSELRQRNVRTLERMLNETFELVYQNDSYATIELDGDYQLTVYQKDGEALEPEQLSGGERALFNLSLRCAIYRLLAEGIEGAAPMPTLILDEPTVFLDAGHVSRLVTLVDSMRDLGVEQIVVVSHDEELVGAADELVTVEKDPTTNRSSVERVQAGTSVVAD